MEESVRPHCERRWGLEMVTLGWMRKLLWLVPLASAASPVFAATRITVEQLRQTLAAAQGKPDAEVARQLSDLELTERLGTAALARLQVGLSGEKARQALTVLADTSAFLDPPAAEIPAQPAPDTAAQRKILAQTVNYVSRTVPQLPNFFATRVTTSFENTPAAQRPGAISSQGMTSANTYQPLHEVDVSSATVLYRDGHEVVDAGAVKVKSQHAAPKTLTTAGVFGPILATVLVDAAGSNKLTWSRWEQGADGLEAVFSYAVPREKSHYTVSWDSVDGEDAIGGCSLELHPFRKLVPYHGEIAVDAASGTILRLVLIADMKPDDFTVKSGIVVEYGQVEIGGKSYFGPVKSVSLTLAHFIQSRNVNGCLGNQVQQTLKTSLNDVVFEQYHMFRAEATVLAESEAEKLESQPQPVQPEAGVDQAVNTPAPATTEPHPAPEPASTAEANPPAVLAQEVPAANSTAASGSAATTLPPASDATGEEQESLLSKLPVYRTNARDVLLDVVVTRSNGDAVLGLTQNDFAVKEDGKPQKIDFLQEHTAHALPSAALQPLPKMPPNTYTNAQPAPVDDSVNVLLLDTLNTPQQDQAFVHNEINDFLKKMEPGTRVAIFALGSKLRYVQGFTTDTSVLLAALNDKRKGASPVKLAGTRDRGDRGDNAEDAARLNAMQVHGVGALEAAQADMSIYDFGARASMTFEALNRLALYLAGVPGRKNLIWFSSSFPVVVFPTVAQRKSIENSPNLRGYLDEVRKTADMLTVSKVAVYPVGAEGVMTDHIWGADSAGPPGAAGGTGHFGSLPDGPMTNGTMTPFVDEAGGRANTIAAMEELADSTGGKAYFNSNDLNGALKRAIDDGANYYTLSYAPAKAKMDGSYRAIEVRLTNNLYRLAYRRGYNADNLSAIEAQPGRDRLQPLLKLGLPSATGILYGVRVAPAAAQPAADAALAGQNSKLKSPLTRYSVNFFIRGSDLALESNPQGERTGKIELGLTAYDQVGNAVNWDGVTQAMNLRPDEFAAMQKSGVPAPMEIDLPSDAAYLVTGVYDWGTGKTGTLEVPLHFTAKTATQAAARN